MLDKIASDIEHAYDAPTDTASALKPIPLRRLWWAAILLLGLSVGAVGFTIWQLGTTRSRPPISDTGNIAAVLAGQMSRSLHTIDAMLLEIRSTSKGLDIDTPDKLRSIYGTKEMHATMRGASRRGAAHLQHRGRGRERTARRLDRGLADARTSMSAIATTSRPPGRAFDGQLSTSVPIKNRIDGSQTIVFARRLDTSSGAFAGIIFASVNSNYFEAIYGSTQSVQNADLQPHQGGRHDPVPSSGQRSASRARSSRSRSDLAGRGRRAA